jgi:cytochrome c556
MNRTIAALTLALSTAVGTSALCVTALADPSPEDARAYRVYLMTAMRGHVGAISMNLRGLVDDHGFLPQHAEALANAAAELTHAFPQGSNVGESEALPAIWEQPEEFAEAVARAETATAAFSEAASAGDKQAVDAALREVGAACRGCHDRFRKDDE